MKIQHLFIAVAMLVSWSLSSCEENEEPITLPQPTAEFTANVDGFELTLTNTSENASSFIWNFGDGTSSTQKNPVKTYAENGTYTVTLTSTGEGGTASASQSITIDVAPDPAVAAFTFSVNDFEVTFTNESENADTYSWDFGDNTTSDLEDPIKIYAENGTYTVTLTSLGEGGTSSVSQTITIDVAPPPVADFSFSINDFEVTFTNESENATSYSWNMGDGSTTTETHPIHTYSSNGTYTVELTATGEGGTQTTSQNVTIDVAPINLPESFKYNFYTLAGDFSYAMSDDSSGDYILEGDNKYYYDPTRHVFTTEFNGYTVYEVQGKTSGDEEKTFWIHQKGSEYKDLNKIYISLTAANSGYTEYARVSAQTVSQVIYNTERGSFVYNSGADKWYEYAPNGSTNGFTRSFEDDEWTVHLTKDSNDDSILLNINTMEVLYAPVGGSYSVLYTIIEAKR